MEEVDHDRRAPGQVAGQYLDEVVLAGGGVDQVGAGHVRPPGRKGAKPPHAPERRGEQDRGARLAVERVGQQLERRVIAAGQEEAAGRQRRPPVRRRLTAALARARLDPLVQKVHRKEPLPRHPACGDRAPLGEQIDRARVQPEIAGRLGDREEPGLHARSP